MAANVITMALLSLWLATTVLYATPLGTRLAAKRALLLRLVPQWNFFAPIPGTHDFHLLYRDQLADGRVGPWRECAEFTGKRSAAAPIWHPEKRVKKTICDITVTFMGNPADTATPIEQDLVKLSMPHLLLLNYVAALPRSSLSAARQFVLIETCASDPKPNILVLSGLHSL
jgi:hypothetical protein